MQRKSRSIRRRRAINVSCRNHLASGCCKAFIKFVFQPRFHFSSDSLFEFAESYRITLHSLPKSVNRTNVVVKDSRMPVDPGEGSFSQTSFDLIAHLALRYSVAVGRNSAHDGEIHTTNSDSHCPSMYPIRMRLVRWC